MLSTVDFGGKPFHFIGIGGIGMSALARILIELKLPVSGSDAKLNHITQQLQDLGATIFSPQKADNLNPSPQPVDQDVVAPTTTAFAAPTVSSNVQAAALETSHLETGHTLTLPARPLTTAALPQVVCSTAIQPDNVEYQAALELGCPILHRSDLLAALMTRYRSVAVAGTHGKTTTSSLIGHLLYQTQLDPTLIIGGEVQGLNTNARLGQGDYLVAEADESDGSLVKFQPHIGIVTNIELDHPDHYTDLDQLVATFEQFAQHAQILIGSVDCATVRERLPLTTTYSLVPGATADYTVDQVHYAGSGTTARVWERGKLLGSVTLQLLGSHNLSNALAAIATGRHLGLEFAAIATALASFTGVRRRFEDRGSARGITLIDDYAHHPSEIRVTLAAARLQVTSNVAPEKTQYQRVVAIFQPHRYSRTRALLNEFAQSFKAADVVVLCDIYSAGEASDGQTTGQDLVDATRQHHANVHYCQSLSDLAPWLANYLQPGDLALFLGAGNLNQTIPSVLDQLQSVA
ncbi:MAG: UDP-N-acetylmuramate--L-alanine ligase [Cyanobacteria bacterium P01_H01_bin.121]